MAEDKARRPPWMSDDDEKTLRWLLKYLKRAEDYCRPYFDRAKRHYRLWRFGSAVDKAEWPYVNISKTMDVFSFVEDSTALKIQTLFKTMPFFTMIPRQTSMAAQQQEGIDYKLIGEQVERAVDFVVSHEDAEFIEETTDFIKSGDIFGTAYQGIFPRKNSLIPLFKNYGFWDVLPIPSPRRISKARGIFARDWMTMEDINLEFGTEVGKKIRGPMTGANEVERNWHRQLLNEIGMSDYETESDDIEVLHYLSGGNVISLADRMTILRNDKNAYPYPNPIVQYKYMPAPNEWFGLGIPEVLEFLQEDDNLIRSAVRDNMDLSINKIIKFRDDPGMNTDAWKFYAGALWPVANMNDLEFMDIPDVTQSALMEIQNRKHEKENTLSLFGYARGMTPQHTEQPTTVMKLQQASLNRTDLAVKLAEFGVLQNVAMRVILHIRSNWTLDDYESVIGEPDAGFFDLSPEDIRKYYLIKPVGSSVTNIREIRQQQVQYAMQVLQSIPPQMMMGNITPFGVDWYEAAKATLESADIKNIERILVQIPPEEVEAHEDEVDAQRMAQEMMELEAIRYGEQTGGQQ
jgi:hypothetical protein